MAEFYLQRSGSNGVWEKVDEYIYKNYKHAIDNDKPRYNGNKVKKDGGFITEAVFTSPLTPKDFAVVARFTGISPQEMNPNVTIPGGFVKEPESVTFHKNKRTLLKMNGGKLFSCQERKMVEAVKETV